MKTKKNLCEILTRFWLECRYGLHFLRNLATGERAEAFLVTQVTQLDLHLSKHINPGGSVARDGAGGARGPPIGLKSMQNRTFLVLLKPVFAQKMKTALLKGFWSRSCEGVLFLFFFWRSPVFGRKNRLNFRFRPKNPSRFR